MRRTTRGIIASLATLSLTVGLAACTDAGDDPAKSTATAGAVSGPKDRLTVLAAGPAQAWDPQRITDRRTAGFASRTWMRTLTAYTPDSSLSGQRTLTGDLAKDTGSPNEDATTWTFSLRSGAKWQDGSAITCADVQYGVSRSFDPGVRSSGYALTYLDIPKKPDGSSQYPGPTVKGGPSAKEKKLLEEAVECTNSTTVVFHLAESVGNFDEIVSLPEFAPFKASKDGKGATYGAFSSGPYRLKGDWTASKGGTWVRNDAWDDRSDPVRQQGPKTILHKEGVEPQDALSAIVEGKDGGRTLALDPMPASLQPAIDEAGEVVQSVDTDGQLVDYLSVNAESAQLDTVRARRALAAATDREAFTKAVGSGVPTWSLLGTALPSAHDTVLDHGPGGDPSAAKKLLAQAKAKPPIKLTLAHRADESLTQGLKALLPGWKKAGFEVTLKPIKDDDYFEQIGTRSVAQEHDLVWANWGPDFPSAVTVLPPLFDDRINLSKESVGRDYGLYADDATNKAMDKAVGIRADKDRAKAWAQVDTDLLREVAYLPLSQSRLTYVAGSEVTAFTGNPIHGGIPELGTIGVDR